MVCEGTTSLFFLVRHNRRVLVCSNKFEIPVVGLLDVVPESEATTAAAEDAFDGPGSGIFDADLAFLCINRCLFDTGESGGFPLHFPIKAMINETSNY